MHNYAKRPINICNVRVCHAYWTHRSSRLEISSSLKLLREEVHSWTDDRVVAESFANNKRKFFYEGTTVLETLAPPEAIICVPRLCIDDLPHDVEAEYLVDRRRLRSVKMIAKYPPTSGIGLKAKGK